MTNTGDQIVVKCPECGNRYKLPATALGKRANCKCGVTFEIRAPAAPPDAPSATPGNSPFPETTSATPPPTSAPGDCANHPGVAAQFGCSRCHSLICPACDTPQPDGSHVCSKCVAKGPIGRPFQPGTRRSTAMPSAFPQPLPAGTLSAPGFGPVAPGASPAGPMPPSMASTRPMAAPLTGVKCTQHAETQAVVRCMVCSTPVCETCVFRFPNGASLCPKCATDTSRPFSKKRKMLAGWSLGLAGLSTLMLILVSTGSLVALPMEVGILLFLACFGIGFVSVIVGVVLALCSMSKREGNPPIVWIAVIWNGLLIAIPLVGFVALIALGIMVG